MCLCVYYRDGGRGKGERGEEGERERREGLLFLSDLGLGFTEPAVSHDPVWILVRSSGMREPVALLTF